MTVIIRSLILYTSDNSEENIFLADALKYHVILFFSARKEQEEQPVSASYCETTDNLLQQADYVMVMAGLTPQTHGLIGEREMELMKTAAPLTGIS